MTKEELIKFGYQPFRAKIGTLYMRYPFFCTLDEKEGTVDYRYQIDDMKSLGKASTMKEIYEIEKQYYINARIKFDKEYDMTMRYYNNKIDKLNLLINDSKEIHQLLKRKGIRYKLVSGLGSNYSDFGLEKMDDYGEHTEYVTSKELMDILFPDFVLDEDNRYPTVYAIDIDKHSEEDILECDFVIEQSLKEPYYIYFSAWVKGKEGCGVSNYLLYTNIEDLKRERINNDESTLK